MATIANLTIKMSAETGALEASFKKVGDATKQLESQIKGFSDAGRRIWEQTRTPLEKYANQVRELNRLFRGGWISADTYGRAIKQAQSAMIVKAEEVKRPGIMASGLKSLIGAYLGLAAARRAAGFVGGQLDYMDKSGKLADRLGTTPEALEKLRFAAEQAGGGSGEMDAALEKLNKSLGEARLGSKELADAFQGLGLDALELSSLDTGEAMAQIADKIAKIHDPAYRAAVVTKIFGRNAAGLINVLKEGRAGLDAYGKKAEELGIIFNRVDAAKAEGANDAMNRLARAMAGLGQAMATTFAPALEKIVDLATSLLARFKDIAGVAGSSAPKGKNERGFLVNTLDSMLSDGDGKSAALQSAKRTLVGSLIKTFTGSQGSPNEILDALFDRNTVGKAMPDVAPNSKAAPLTADRGPIADYVKARDQYNQALRSLQAKNFIDRLGIGPSFNGPAGGLGYIGAGSLDYLSRLMTGGTRGAAGGLASILHKRGPMDYMAAGALEQGSSEAYSAGRRNQFNNAARETANNTQRMSQDTRDMRQTIRNWFDWVRENQQQESNL